MPAAEEEPGQLASDSQLKATTVIYSAVVAGYDRVCKPKVRTRGVRYLLFSDRADKVAGWTTKPIKEAQSSASLTNRWYKFFPHKAMQNVEYSMYVDGNRRITEDLTSIFEEFRNSGAALGLFLHSDRSTIAEEVAACRNLGKFDADDEACIEGQLLDYKAAGLPDDQPLFDNGVLFRWHKHPQLAQSMQEWWHQHQRYSKRDQISLPYVIWKTNLPILIWRQEFRVEGASFQIYPHNGSWLRNLITRIQIYKQDYWILKLLLKVKRLMKLKL
ncbi:MAG: DUF616 domain-containing protein [Pseudomonadales bacterium]|nr:DUF616 domain-containing protein [Pseudomonadales bacterium]